jgi:hypothetical protein
MLFVQASRRACCGFISPGQHVVTCKNSAMPWNAYTSTAASRKCNMFLYHWYQCSAFVSELFQRTHSRSCLRYAISAVQAKSASSALHIVTTALVHS